MKRCRIVIFLLCSVIAQISFSQEKADIKVVREREFLASGLYGYMNGGTDLFLEYGVKKLTTTDLTFRGESYTLNVFEMPTPEDAFGIYSLHVFKCLRADTLDCIECLSTYQLQKVVGKYYYSLVFQSGSSAARHNADELLNMYIKNDSDKGGFFPEILNLQKPYTRRVKMLRGPISLSNASFPLSELIKDIPFERVWIVTEEAASDTMRVLIYPKDKNQMDKLKEKFQEKIIQSGTDFVYVSYIEPEEDDTDKGDFGF